MTNKEETPIYPADGTPSALPDPKEWANHSEEQEQVNREGIEAARAAIRGESSKNPTEEDSSDEKLIDNQTTDKE